MVRIIRNSVKKTKYRDRGTAITVLEKEKLDRMLRDSSNLMVWYSLQLCQRQGLRIALPSPNTADYIPNRRLILASAILQRAVTQSLIADALDRPRVPVEAVVTIKKN